MLSSRSVPRLTALDRLLLSPDLPSLGASGLEESIEERHDTPR